MSPLKHIRHPLLTYSFIIAIPVLWGAFLSLPGVQAPIGNNWWDYFALKGLEIQIFNWDTPTDEMWLPFILPVTLFKLANIISGLGVDYLLAHCIICIALLIFSYKPIFLRLPSHIRLPVFVTATLFMIIPTDLSFQNWSFQYINGIYYKGFYNRYLDVIFCFLAISIFLDCTKKSSSHFEPSKILFLSFALITALFSKASYFIVFLLMTWASSIISKDRSNFIGFATGLFASFVLFFTLPNYYETLLEIIQVRKLELPPLIFAFVLIAGLVLSAWAFYQGTFTRKLLLIPTLLLPAHFLTKGNYGDYYLLRMAVAVIACSLLLKHLDIKALFSMQLSHKEKRKSISLTGIKTTYIAVLILALPAATLLKATIVTISLTIGNYLNIGSGYTSFPNIPGFFSHPSYIHRELRDAFKANPNLHLPVSELRHNYTASYFTFYARDLDNALESLKATPIENVAWFSFPAMTPEILGLGKTPPSGRPWYLFGHEINKEIHPDFKKISSESNIHVIDECNIYNIDRLKLNFGDALLSKNELLWKTHCFHAYGEPTSKLAKN